MDRLEQLIKVYSAYNGEIKNLLQELQQRRQSDLRPADKFLRNTPQKQLLHVVSEIHEIQDAIFKLQHPTMDSNYEVDRMHVLEEIIDGQTGLQTLAKVLKFTDEEIMEARRKVIQKNTARGYYEDGVADES